MPRTTGRWALAVLAVAAMVAASATVVSASATVASASPIATQAPGSTGVPGSAWAWGENTYGDLGNATTANSSTAVPVGIPPSATIVTAIAGGWGHSLAITSNGRALAWGSNVLGQLGNGTTSTTGCTCIPFPVSVSLPSGTTVTAIAGGGSHSLAVTSDGHVLAWGNGAWGALGNGTQNESNVPVMASMPSGTVATAVAAGRNHSLALTSTGQVFAWGDNSYGELGNGTTVSTLIPVPVSLPSGTTVIAIAAGEQHNLALTSTGTVLAWGYNYWGQLGNGTTTTTGCSCSRSPVLVSLAPGTSVAAIAGGRAHSLAVTSAGQVLAWGNGQYGQLGNGLTSDSSIPIQLSMAPGTVVGGIAAGSDHSLVFTSRGQVLAWGYNYHGELGNGTTTTTGCWCISYPVAVSAFPAAGAVAAGGNHSVAIQLPAAAVFPAVSNGAYGGYVTAATIQNTGSAPAIVHIDYFDQNGAPVGSGDSMASLAVNASWTVRQDNGNSFPSSGGDASQAGSAVVFSTQPIASFVNEFAPANVGDATSYSGVQVPSGVATTLYAPTIVNNAYGGYTTGIGLLNQGTSPTDVTISYRNGSGSVVKTQTVSGLAAHAYRSLYSGDAVLALPSGFAGTATMTSSNGQPLGAVVNEVGPGGQFSSYDAVASANATLNVPVALNNAFGGYYTGLAIQNTTGSIGTVSVTYYDASGTGTAKSFSIGPYGSLGVFQGSATDGPPIGAYTAVIQGIAVLASLKLAAIVNEVAPPVGTAQMSTAYNTVSAGSAFVHLPLVENAGGDPWNTGEGIMNTGTSNASLIVYYYDASTGAAVGTPQMHTLAPHAFWGLYQPTNGLPSGKRATAVIISLPTPFLGQVAVICNESSATTFMSYDGQ